MGLSNASQMFQRAMEKVLKGLLGTIALLYIDDILIYSRNEEEHVQHLQILFDRLRQYDLAPQPFKVCFWAARSKVVGLYCQG
jgi:uncharacterized protein YcaQ